MARQFLVIAYDIPDDRRRARLHHTLEGFGTPVQYSVFECLLQPRDVPRVQRAVMRVISRRKDHVRYYYLCGACQKRIESTRGPEIAHQEPCLVV